VFKSIRTSGLLFRLSLTPFAFLAGLAASAQTAPQLLPYTSKLIAGGGTATIAKGGTCPVSGYTSLDAYGDGCLATEVLLGNNTAGTTPGARYAVSDTAGNVFFTDYNNGLVRRVDAITGIVTAVAGGATSSPASGTACGTGVSVDAAGDGCLANLVKLSHPVSLVFSPAGDLYFGDPGAGQVRKIAATGGLITTTGVISLIVGNASGTYGFGASNTTTTVNVGGANSYLRTPDGLAFDTKGDLFIVDEYTEAILVANLGTTTNLVNTVSVPAGQIWKVAGSQTAGSAASPNNTTYCTNGTASGYGCNYGLYVESIQANGDEFDSTYSVAVGPDGTLYAGNEYYDSIFKVSPAGVLNTFAGIQNSVGTKPIAQTKRGLAGSFGIGSPFGVAADANSNVYFGDASSGYIWRVDGAGLSQYVVAGGAATTCAAATDTYGDGCPALQATLGHSGSANYATATLPGPGVYGITVDAYSDLFFGDTETNLVREIASGTQFGVVGANQPTDIVDIHFAQGDSPAASAYLLTSGASNFSLGTATCTANSDTTIDCLLPVTATPSVLGPFTGTLQVTSTKGGVGTFPLTGYYAQSPTTRTAVSYAASGVSCSGTTTYSTATPIVITATLVANGPAAPTGTVTFFSNNGTATTTLATVNVSNLGTTANPVYGATYTTTFGALGTYTLSATYSGDAYFKTSTGKAANTLTTATASYSTSLLSYQQSTVSAGQTGLYSFNVAQTVYTGTITFACSGLPANASCSFSPASITAAGCSVTNVVALSILTQQGTTVQPGSFGGGRGGWQILSVLASLTLALMIGVRRRRVPMRYGQIWMALALLIAASSTVACGKSVGSVLQAGTPSGSYTVTVTATGTTGSPTSFTVPLTVK
jgi:hypothetical protein